MMFSWIFFLAIVIWAIWYFGKDSTDFLQKIPKDDPIDILRRRFAEGEIDEDEYDERRAVLEEDEFFKLKP